MPVKYRNRSNIDLSGYFTGKPVTRSNIDVSGYFYKPVDNNNVDYGQSSAQNVMQTDAQKWMNDNASWVSKFFSFKPVATALKGLDWLGTRATTGIYDTIASATGKAKPVSLLSGRKDTSDILDLLGWKEGEADADNKNDGLLKGFFTPQKNNFDYRDVVAFLGDVALDPTTYVTFGAGSAVKAGVKAAQATSKNVAAKYGIKAVKSGNYNKLVRRTGNDVYDKVYKDTVALGKNADEAARAANLASIEARNMIKNASKVARRESENALMSFDLPFTSVSKTLIKRPKILKKEVAKIGSVGANSIKTSFKLLDINDAEGSQMIKNRYGVSKVEDLNEQQLADYNETLINLNKGTTGAIKNDLVKENVNEYLIRQIVTAVRSQETRSAYSQDTVYKLIDDIDYGLVDDEVKNLAQNYLDEVDATAKNFIPDETLKALRLNHNLNSVTSLNEYKKGLANALKKYSKKMKLDETQKAALHEEIVEATFARVFEDILDAKKAEKIQAKQVVQRTFVERRDLIKSQIGGKPSVTAVGVAEAIANLEKDLPELEELMKASGSLEEMAQKLGINTAGSAEDLDVRQRLIDLDQMPITNKAERDAFFAEAKKTIKDDFGFNDIKFSNKNGKTISKNQSINDVRAGEVKQILGQMYIINRYGLNAVKPNMALHLYSRGNVLSSSSGKAAAYYSSGYKNPKFIAIAKEQADSLIHEYMHYLDHRISTKGFTEDATSGLHSGALKSINYKGNELENYVDILLKEYVKKGYISDKFEPTTVGELKYIGYNSSYYFSQVEILARALPELLSRSSVARILKNEESYASFKEAIAKLEKGNNMIDMSTLDVDNAAKELFKVFENLGLKRKDGGVLTQEDIDVKLSEIAKEIEAKNKELGFLQEKQTQISKQLQEIADTLTLEKFETDMGGKTIFGRYVTEQLFPYFNPRTLGNKSKNAAFINGMANTVQDGLNKYRSLMAEAAKDVKNFRTEVKKQVRSGNVTEADLNHLVYLIEDAYPGGVSKFEFLEQLDNAEALEELALQAKNIIDKHGLREVYSGALTKQRKNYFPHVLKNKKYKVSEFENLMNDKFIKKFVGKSVRDKFSTTRSGYQSFAELDDALTALKQKRDKLKDPEEIRKAQKLIDNLENRFERDIYNALNRRFSESVRASAMSETYRILENNGAIIRANSPLKMKANEYEALGYVKVTAGEAKSIGYFQEGDFVLKDVMAALKKTDQLFNIEVLQTIYDSFLSLQNIWKQITTNYRLVHHQRNMLGNIANNAMVGVMPDTYVKASILMRRWASNRLTDEDKEWIRLMYDDGILVGGSQAELHDFIREERIAQSGNMVTKAAAKVEDVIANNFVGRAFRAMGTYIDMHARMSHYMHIYNKTGSSQIAKDSVRKYLYNYNELTDLDRGIRALIPFYTFTKKNLPRMYMEFLRQPRYFVTYEKMRQALSENQEDDITPSYMDRIFGALPVGRNAFWNPGIPAAQIGDLEADKSNFIFNSLTPFVKVPFELEMNKQFFNDAPIDPYAYEGSGYSTDSQLKYWSGQAGVLGDIGKLLDPNLRPEGRSLGEQIVSNTFGSKMEVDQVKERRKAKYERDKIRRLEKARRKAAAKKAQRGFTE